MSALRRSRRSRTQTCPWAKYRDTIGVRYSVCTCDVSRPPTTAKPSGRRYSAPVPRPNAIGKRSEQCGKAGHQDRAQSTACGASMSFGREVTGLRDASTCVFCEDAGLHDEADDIAAKTPTSIASAQVFAAKTLILAAKTPVCAAMPPSCFQEAPRGWANQPTIATGIPMALTRDGIAKISTG